METQLRCALVLAAIAGVLGGVRGFMIGLDVYAPTACAAAFEIGIPAAVVGAVLGFAVGSIAEASQRRR